jgi:hypothetical protein
VFPSRASKKPPRWIRPWVHDAVVILLLILSLPGKMRINPNVFGTG